jgi:hypothetical protein
MVLSMIIACAFGVNIASEAKSSVRSYSDVRRAVRRPAPIRADHGHRLVLRQGLDPYLDLVTRPAAADNSGRWGVAVPARRFAPSSGRQDPAAAPDDRTGSPRTILDTRQIRSIFIFGAPVPDCRRGGSMSVMAIRLAHRRIDVHARFASPGSTRAWRCCGFPRLGGTAG